jgi:transposase
MLDTHQALRQVERALEGEVQADPALERMATVVGKTSAAVLCASLGPPQGYPDAAAYLKSAGLNLKERSSGSYPGQLKITKRGPSVARRYLYLAALRWIARDAQVQDWYRRKVQRDGGLKGKAVIARVAPSSLGRCGMSGVASASTPLSDSIASRWRWRPNRWNR